MRLIFNGIWTCEFHGMLWDFSCKTIGPNSFIIHLSHSAFPCSIFETETTSYFSTILFFLKFRFVFFELLCGYLTANFLPLLRIQPHIPNVHHCVLWNSMRSSPGASLRGLVPKPGRAPRGVWTENLQILIITS